ncbi:hypothetical protein [Microcoleus sp. FACHB-68]|nr:hypothetical protein [Microcoleus sp. FACHB-68]
MSQLMYLLLNPEKLSDVIKAFAFTLPLILTRLFPAGARQF